MTLWQWIMLLAAVALATAIYVIIRKSQPLPGEHVFHASRMSKGNRIFPSQVVITPSSVTLYHPQWIGKLEESIHMAHVASIKIDTSLIFSDVFIETSGGQDPIVCHGHTKGDAVQMKKVIEEYQSAYFKADKNPPIEPPKRPKRPMQGSSI